MRKTPCVDGCCGPKWSSISSASGSYFSMTTWGSTRAEDLMTFVVVISSPRRSRRVRLEVPPQRVAHVVLGHHQPAQIGVPRELHADEVVLLALLPVGA